MQRGSLNYILLLLIVLGVEQITTFRQVLDIVFKKSLQIIVEAVIKYKN